MSEITERDYLPDSPYPGIEPFSYAYRNVFFAREREARALLQLVVIYRGVLLYSESGVGKSSLVNAGLIPRAIAEGYQPERLRIQPRKGEEIIVKRLSVEATEGAQCLPSLFAADQHEQDVALSVEEFMEIVRRKADPVQPLLIFDQFEEWTTLFEEGHSEYSTGELRQMQQAILGAIVALLNDRQLPVKLLIVLREDYLAQLTPLFERCPTLVDQYLRLTPLDGEQVFRTIRGPFDDFPGHYRPEISADLAKTIRDQFEERTRGANIRLTEVQIVCQSLFGSADQGSDPDQKFAEHGNVQGLLEEYLEGALKSLPMEQQDPAVELLTRMVTSGGTRKRISQEDLLTVELLRQMREEGVSEDIVVAALNNLEQPAKLVRREPLRNISYYEIASEFLVDWIQKEAEARKLRRAEVEAADEARRHAMERSARRMRNLVVALAIACLFAVVAAVFAFMQGGEALAALAIAYAANTASAANEATAAAVGATAAENKQVAQDSLATQEAAILEQLPTPTLTLWTPTPTRAGVPSGTGTPTPTASAIPTVDAGATEAALEEELAIVRATQTAVAPQPLPGDALTQMTFDKADESVPSLSPDQGTLLIESNRTGTPQIFALDPDGSNWRPLTSQEAGNAHPRFSPYGQRIVFASNRTGDWEIFAMRPDGSDVNQLTFSAEVDSYPSYSSDGQWILFMSKRSGSWGIYIMSADGSQVRRVIDTEKDELYPWLSPDGKAVVFQADLSGNWDIYTIPTDGGTVARLTDSAARDAQPVFTPDGRSIVFETSRDGDYEIYVMNADGTDQRNLTNAPSSREQVPSVSPDGRWVLFQSKRYGSWDIFRVPLTTGLLEIPQTYTADLDAGVIGAGSDADIWFEAVTATERYLVPQNGAMIAVVGTSSVGRDGCAAAPLSTARIPVNDLPEGTYVCVRTNLDRYSQFRVNAPIGPSPGMLVIGYTTWK